LALAALLAVGFAPAADVAIRFTGGAFQVTSWKAGAEPPDGWASAFTVSTTVDGPPMLGAYTVEDGTLTFRPRWPIAPGIQVHAVFRTPSGPSAAADFAIAPAPAGPATHIVQIYPSTSDLPANALRLYVYFSAPMRRGEAWEHIHLLDESGAAVDRPFLEIDQELWDSGNIRLTILFDPGRIKRGLVPLRDSGPNLVEGRTYTLAIDRDWRDANGQPLEAGVRKQYRVTPAVRALIEPAKWRLTSPRQGTVEPLVVTFPQPLDYALALRTLSVAGVKGTASVDRQETEWSFVPDEAWKASDYQLVVSIALEDRAGNRIDRVFDVDTFNRIDKQIHQETVTLPFRIR
jgi:hypothetical protein